MKKNIIAVLIVVLLVVSIVVVTSMIGIKFQTLSFTPQDKYSYTITINPQQTYTCANQPIEIYLTSANFNDGFAKTELSEDGKDLRFYDTDGTPLKQYIAKFSKANKYGDIFVRIPVLSNVQKTIYMGFGTTFTDISDSTIFKICNGFESSAISWQVQSGCTIVKSIDSREKTYSEKIEFQSTDNGRAFLNLAFPSSSSSISFWFKRADTYTGTATGYNIYVHINGRRYPLSILSNGDFYIYGSSSTKGAGIFTYDTWREIYFMIDTSISNVDVQIRDIGGNVLYNGYLHPCGSLSSTMTGLSINATVGYGYFSGDVFFDFVASANYCCPPVLGPLVVITPPVRKITVLTSPLTFPESTDNCKIRVSYKYGDSPQVNIPIEMKILSKGSYTERVFPQVPTGVDGIAELSFTSPPSTDSPYTAVFTSQDSYATSISVTLNSLSAVTLSPNSLLSTQPYDTVGGVDLQVSFSVLVNGNPIPSSYAIDQYLVEYNGQDIGKTYYSYQKEVASFVVQAKIYAKFGDTATRDISVYVKVSSSSYFSGECNITIKMVKPSININFALPSSFTVGRTGIEVILGDSNIDDYEIIVKYLVDNTFVDFKKTDIIFIPQEKRLFADYTFTKTGQYQITARVWQASSLTEKPYTVQVTPSSPLEFLSPTTILISMVVLLIIYTLYKKAKRKSESQ